jgi:endonuclease/exonuclease/phosphatase family metal-dependent hydrolase
VNTAFCFLFNQVMPVRKDKRPVPDQFAQLDGVQTNEVAGVKKTADAKVLPERFRIATWNIEMGHQREKLIQDLPTIRAEVILLQEVPVFTRESAPLLAEYGAYYAYAPGLFVRKTNPWYSFVNRGQLTLSNVAPQSVDAVPLPRVSVYDTHRRSRHSRQIALYTRIKTAKGTLGIYNIHLDNFCAPTGRRRQLGEIFEQVRKRKDKYVIIAGDFNTVYGKLELIGITKKTGLVRAKTGRTCGLLRLDHIFHTQNMKVEAKVLKKKSSDHKPIYAEITLL